MGFFDDYFDSRQYEPGGGLTALLQSLPQQDYQPGGGVDGWPQGGQAVNPGLTAPTSASQPPQSPAGNVPIPTPRPTDIPLRSIAIGEYRMPQYSGTQDAPYSQAQPDLGDRLGAGFKSWAYTPVGNPFAALANAITGLSTGQFAAAPALTLPDLRSRLGAPSQEDGAIAPAGRPMGQAPPIARSPTRPGFPSRR